MALQATHKKVVTERSGETREQRYIERFRPVNLKRVDVLRIVAVHKRAAYRRGQPVVALSKRYLMVQNAIGNVRFENAEYIGRCDRPAGMAACAGLVGRDNPGMALAAESMFHSVATKAGE